MTGAGTSHAHGPADAAQWFAGGGREEGAMLYKQMWFRTGRRGEEKGARAGEGAPRRREEKEKRSQGMATEPPQNRADDASVGRARSLNQQDAQSAGN